MAELPTGKSTIKGAFYAFLSNGVLPLNCHGSLSYKGERGKIASAMVLRGQLCLNQDSPDIHDSNDRKIMNFTVIVSIKIQSDLRIAVPLLTL